MKYYKYLLTQLLILSSLAGLLGQTNKKTLNYQAVILDPKAIDIPGASIVGQPLNKGNVCLRFSLINAQGGLDYEETQQVTTDEYGLVNVAIGAGAQAQSGNSTSIYKSFESVVWNSSVKSLKVSVSYDGCSSFKQVSSQAFNYTPYALYAESVDYKNVRDAPTKLSQFTNDPGYIIPKDLDPLKADIKTNTSQLATANQAIADNKKSSDAAFLIVNQSITSLDTKVADNTTAINSNTSSITNINTKLSDQQNQITATNNNLNTQIGGLQGQLNTTNSTVSNLTGTAEVVSNKSTETNLGGASPSDQLYPSQKAAKSYIDNAIYDAVGSGVPDATTLAAGKVKLAGDLGGTAASPTVPALAGKENSSNKATAIDLGAGNPSDQLYPSQKATKAYVDNSIYQAVGSGVPDATTNAAGKLKLAGDLGGTAASPTVPGLQLKEDVSNKSNSTSLGTSTTAYPTQNAVKTYVDAQIANATIADASSSAKGKIQLAGALGGTAAAPTVPGLLLKEDLENKSAAADLGAGSTSDDKYPSQKAVKTYVDNQVASATIADASATIKGKLQLAGDLAGTNSSSSAPVISNNAINSAKIEDRSITTVDIADAAITDVKIAGLAGSKVSGNISGNAANVTGLIAVGNGGTGSTSLTGYVKGNGTSAMTTVSSIPVSDVTGAVKKVNGTLPNSTGEVTILFGRVTTGNYANVPTSGGVNGDIYIVSGDGNNSNNGRTFIKDDSVWNEVSPNTAATDARYLQLGGGIMEGNISFPTGKKVILTDAPSGSTDAANKNYVDMKISTEVPNASTTAVGKIQLAGDLGGTALLPTVPGLAEKAPKNNPAFSGTVTGITKAMVGLENVNNTSDASKPVSNATQSALDAKAPLASPSFTGTATFEIASGITKSMVGLGSVDNTSDLAKPVSTSTQTALDAKENTSNKSNDVTLGTSTTAYPTQNAVKTYVDNTVSSGSPDANVSTKGKVQLAGDLGGTNSSAAAPIISNAAISTVKLADLAVTTGKIDANAVTSTKILDGEIVNADISTNAAIADSKLATIATMGKVSNSATTATNANTASAIVARDANGNFSAGTITADLSGNASTATKLAASKTINGIAFDGSANITVTADASTLTGASLKSTVLSSSLTSVGTLTNLTVTNPIAGSITGNAANVTGTVAVGNGGTGATTLTGLVKGNGTSAMTAAAAGTDYQAPITLTTTGTGAATFSGNTLNIPAVSSTVNAGSISGTVAVGNGGTGATTLTGLVKGNGTSAMTAATAGTDYQAPITLTTTGTGAATFSGNTLNIPAVSSTVNAGSISGTVAVANGGTGAITLTAGSLLKGNGTSAISAATAGTDYSAGTSSLATGILKSTTITGALTIASVADFPTLNQNTTGNASTATTAGNITATSNTSLTSLSNLNAVGTITSGTISVTTNIKTSNTITAGTVTYPNTHGTNGQVLSTTGNGTLTWTTTAAPSDAATSAKGIVQLAGDLGGTASLPTVNSVGGVSSSTIGTINTTVTAATNNNTVSTLVKRDASGNFSAGTITAALTGNVTGNLSGNASTATTAGNITATSNNTLTSISTLSTVGTITSGTISVTTDIKTAGKLVAGTVTYPNTHGTSGQLLSTTGSGTLTWTSGSSVSIFTDEPSSITAGQTSFTLTNTPLSGRVWMYINGTRISKNAYAVSGTTVTYTPSFNNSYTLIVGDRIQFDYVY